MADNKNFMFNGKIYNIDYIVSISPIVDKEFDIDLLDGIKHRIRVEHLTDADKRCENKNFKICDLHELEVKYDLLIAKIKTLGNFKSYVFKNKDDNSDLKYTKTEGTQIPFERYFNMDNILRIWLSPFKQKNCSRIIYFMGANNIRYKCPFFKASESIDTYKTLTTDILTLTNYFNMLPFDGEEEKDKTSELSSPGLFNSKMIMLVEPLELRNNNLNIKYKNGFIENFREFVPNYRYHLDTERLNETIKQKLGSPTELA